MQNFQCIFFIWTRIYKEIFKSALVYFQVRQSPEAVIHRCSPVKLVRFLRTPLQNTSGNCSQTSSFENYTYFRWTYFDYHKNKHKVLYQNHWLALYTVDVLQFHFKKSLVLDLKKLRLTYWAQVSLIITKKGCC